MRRFKVVGKGDAKESEWVRTLKVSFLGVAGNGVAVLKTDTISQMFIKIGRFRI